MECWFVEMVVCFSRCMLPISIVYTAVHWSRSVDICTTNDRFMSMFTGCVKCQCCCFQCRVSTTPSGKSWNLINQFSKSGSHENKPRLWKSRKNFKEKCGNCTSDLAWHKLPWKIFHISRIRKNKFSESFWNVDISSSSQFSMNYGTIRILLTYCCCCYCLFNHFLFVTWLIFKTYRGKSNSFKVQ